MNKRQLIEALANHKDEDRVVIEVHDTILYEDLYDLMVERVDLGNTQGEIRLCPINHAHTPYDMNTLCSMVSEWAERRGLLSRLNKERQMLKVVEEVGEIAAAMARDKSDDLIDAIGDAFVTLIILSNQIGYQPAYPLHKAYETIKDRKGKTVGGVFIKESE